MDNINYNPNNDGVNTVPQLGSVDDANTLSSSDGLSRNNRAKQDEDDNAPLYPKPLNIIRHMSRDINTQPSCLTTARRWSGIGFASIVLLLVIIRWTEQGKQENLAQNAYKR